DVVAHCSVGQLGADVDRPSPILEKVEVLGKGFPTPAHALPKGRSGNVLYAFHQLDELAFLARSHRGEADPAIAHDERGDSMKCRGLERPVPRHLAVVVTVQIDESRGEDPTGGIVS